MTGFRTGAGIVWDEPVAFYYAREQGSYQILLRLCQKNAKAKMKGHILAKEQFGLKKEWLMDWNILNIYKIMKVQYY